MKTPTSRTPPTTARSDSTASSPPDRYRDAPPPTASRSLPPALACKCLLPVETPLSHDGELSARHARHRSPEHFAAVVHDMTWLLHQALATGATTLGTSDDRSPHSASSPQKPSSSSSPTRGDGTAAVAVATGGGGDCFPTAKTRRQLSAQSQRAFAFFRLQQFARAVKDYDACIASEPTAALLYYNRGCAFYAWGKRARAVQDFTRALKLDCKNALFVESRAVVHKELGRFHEAIQDYTWLETLRRMAHRGRADRRDSLAYLTSSGDAAAAATTTTTTTTATAKATATTTTTTAPAGDAPLVGSLRGSFSMSFSELQASLLGAAMAGDTSVSRDSSASRGGGATAMDTLTTEERETHVLEWMARFLQRSPRARRRGDVREAVQHARAWSFFRGMDAAMVEQCLAEAEYAQYDGDAVVVAQGARAAHFHVVLSPTAPFVTNVDARSGVSKLRELRKLSQGDAVGADAFATSLADGRLLTIRHELAAASQLNLPMQKKASSTAATSKTKTSTAARARESRHGSLHKLLHSPSLLGMLSSATGTGMADAPTTTAAAAAVGGGGGGDGADVDEDAALLPLEPASFSSLEPVACLLLAVDAYREILHEHEEAVLEERVAFLRGCRVFQSCSDDVLTALAAVSGARVYDPGKDLLRADDEVAQLCVIRRGVCQVRKTIRVPATASAPPPQPGKKTTTTTTTTTATARTMARLAPLRPRGRGHTVGHDDDSDGAASAGGDGSWVLDNGWMLTNPRLVNTAAGGGAAAALVEQQVDVGILASGQVFGELSVLQPGQPSQVTVRSQTLVEVLTFAQRDLARLHVQYHSGTMNALQESLLFHNPPQQKIVQLQRDLAAWEAQKRGVLRELALQLPGKHAQRVLLQPTGGDAPMKTPSRRRASLVGTRLHASASLPGLAR